jgi:hypothetical protein
MAAQEIVVTPHTLPAGYCFTTLQDLLDTFSSHQTVLLPAGSTQIIVSDSTPGPADQDKVWLKVDGVGNPVNFYWFNGGSWKEVNPPLVFWGIGSNVGNAYTVSVANPPPALVTGQMYMFKVPTSNTGAATLQVNAFGSFSFNAAGVALTAGQLVVNSYIGAIWTGTTFELFGAQSSSIAVSQLIPGTNTQRVTTTGGIAVWQGGYQRLTPVAVPTVTGITTMTHTLGVKPDLYNVYLICTGNNNGWVVDDMIDISQIFQSNAGTDYYQILVATVGISSVVVRHSNLNTGLFTYKNSDGTLVDLFPNIANWKLGASLWVF